MKAIKTLLTLDNLVFQTLKFDFILTVRSLSELLRTRKVSNPEGFVVDCLIFIMMRSLETGPTLNMKLNCDSHTPYSRSVKIGLPSICVASVFSLGPITKDEVRNRPPVRSFQHPDRPGFWTFRILEFSKQGYSYCAKLLYIAVQVSFPFTAQTFHLYMYVF